MLLLLSLLWLVVKDLGQTPKHPLNRFPCQFEEAHCKERSLLEWLLDPAGLAEMTEE